MYESLNTQPLHARVDGENIAGRIVSATGEPAPSVLFLHGAGKSSGERVMYLMIPLAERGVPSVSIDFSGHGSSTGRLKDSSLRKRTAEAAAALRWLDDTRQVVLCGSSMGAHSAIRLLQDISVRALILFCPAVYSRDAFDVPFNGGFSQIIRRPDSWRQSEAFDILPNFKGRLLVLMGELDSVIPRGLPEALLEAATNASTKELLTIPNADHLLHGWIERHPEVCSQVVAKLTEYMS
jgi:pimeloyl-ACP methyl ester carboxylesterase